MLSAAGRAEVGRLRALGAHRDTPALRAALRGRVGAADVRPPHLPPAAILIVRHVAVEPGIRVWSIGEARWERACRGTLGSAAARAARPVRGELLEGAEAVLFRDEAELLAYLALDLARSRAGGRWWWLVLLARLGRDAAAPAALLAAHAEAAPAVLAELCAWGGATPVLATLDEPAASAVLDAFAAAHHVSAFAEAAAILASTHRAEAAAPEPRTHAQHGATSALAGESTDDAAGIGDAAREPAPTSTECERGADHGCAPTDLGPDTLWPRWLRLPAEARRLSPPQRLVLAAGLLLHARPQVARGAAFAAALRRWAAAAAVAPAEQDAAAEAAVAAALAASATLDPGASLWRVEAVSLPVAGAAVPRADAAAEPEVGAEPAVAELDDGIASGLAGTFQLLNVMRRLDLPDAFEADWRLGSKLGSWGVLEALARGLLLEGDDPLWEVLRDLAGREPGEPIGAGCRPPPGRDTLALRDGPLLGALAPGARAWLAEALPGVRGWCALALDVAEEEIAGVLLCRRGTLHVTRTHVDVVMALDEVSLAVRRVGLDADPGWDPALGRVVRLHFREGGAG